MRSGLPEFEFLYPELFQIKPIDRILAYFPLVLELYLSWFRQVAEFFLWPIAHGIQGGEEHCLPSPFCILFSAINPGYCPEEMSHESSCFANLNHSLCPLEAFRISRHGFATSFPVLEHRAQAVALWQTASGSPRVSPCWKTDDQKFAEPILETNPKLLRRHFTSVEFETCFWACIFGPNDVILHRHEDDSVLKKEPQV